VKRDDFGIDLVVLLRHTFTIPIAVFYANPHDLVQEDVGDHDLSWRTIPVSKRAMATLEVWSTNFPNRQPQDYVFPREVYQQAKAAR
jgi:hypothetical protein